MSNQKYPWDELQKRGDFVVVQGVTPRQVSLLARLYLESRFGKGAKVMSRVVEDGTIVAVAYLPPQDAAEVETEAAPTSLRSRDWSSYGRDDEEDEDEDSGEVPEEDSCVAGGDGP